ncbi:hypothetical protein ABH999_000659 [Bradyrhizobium yuanmingense]
MYCCHRRYALRQTILRLTRSSQDRCLKRSDITRLPETECSKPPRKKSKVYLIGYFQAEIA